MNGSLNLLIGLAMGLSLLALASVRLPSVIRAVALQGVVLGLLPPMLEGGFAWPVMLVSVGAIVVKGFVIPAMLRRALRAANIDREVQPLLGFAPTLLLGAAASLASFALASLFPLQPDHAQTLLVPGAFSIGACGFIMLMVRAKAIAQVCGYLLLENGIYLFGLLLIHSTPLLVEAGILLDLTVAVFVIGIIVDRIQREFDTLDTRQFITLRE